MPRLRLGAIGRSREDSGTASAHDPRGRLGDLPWLSCFLVVLGLLVFASGLSQEEMFSRQGIGPGFMPIVTGLALAAVAAADVLRALVGRQGTHEPAEVTRADVYRVVAIGAALVVFTLVLGWIGYRLAMTALLVAVVLVIDRRAWVAAGVTGLVGGFGVAVLFERVLGLYLPLAAVEPLAGLGL